MTYSHFSSGDTEGQRVRKIPTCPKAVIHMHVSKILFILLLGKKHQKCVHSHVASFGKAKPFTEEKIL